MQSDFKLKGISIVNSNVLSGFFILLFVFMGWKGNAQSFEKIYQGNYIKPIELNDSSLLCLIEDSICSINAFDGSMRWKKPIEGIFSEIIKGENDNFYCFGIDQETVYPNDTSHAIVVKVNNIGDTIWTRTFETIFGDPTGELINNKLYFGYRGYDGSIDLYSLSPNGNQIHHKNNFTYGSIGKITSDGTNPVAALNKNNIGPILIIKFDTNLNIVDTILYSPNISKRVYEIAYCDSVYLILTDNYLFTIDKNTGSTMNSYYFNMSSYYGYTFYNDTIVAITGTKNNSLKYDLSILLFDIKNFTLLNSQVFGSYLKHDYGYDILKTNDGALIAGGRTNHNNSNYESCLIRVDSSLNANHCASELQFYQNNPKFCLGDTVRLYNYSYGLHNICTWIVNGDTITNLGPDGQVKFYNDSIGTYNVYLISCDDTISTTYSIFDPTLPQFTYNQFGDSLVFMAASGHGSEVDFWVLGDGYYGGDSIVYHRYADTGTYVVSLHYNNGSCDYLQYDTIYITSLTGLQETPISVARLYPNPSTSGQFYLQASFEIECIQIYNMQGSLIPFKRNENAIEIRQPSSGIYIVMLTDKQGYRSIKKLIIH